MSTALIGRVILFVLFKTNRNRMAFYIRYISSIALTASRRKDSSVYKYYHGRYQSVTFRA